MRFWEKYPLYKQIKALLHWLAPMQISLYAAYTCFYMVLSLLPALVLLLNLLRYAGLEAESLISVVEGFLPDVLVPEAKRLIRETEKNFQEISDSLGFSSAHYFSTIFKKYVGMTPTQYKKSCKQGLN